MPARTQVPPPEPEKSASSESRHGHRNSAVQCELQVMSDLESSEASTAGDSPSSSPYQLQKRGKRTPNHFRSQTAPPYGDRRRARSWQQSPRKRFPDGGSDVSSDTSSLDQAYTSNITCRLSHDGPGFYEYHKPYSVYCKPLRRPLSLPTAFDDSHKLHHPDLNPGQKEYLWHTASVYSVGNLKQLQQRRYKQMLNHQVEIGFHTQEEVDRYYKYLTGTRKRQYEADPSVWRDPPKLPVRPKHFHRRARSYEEVQEARKVNTGYYRGQRTQSQSSSATSSKENLAESMEKLSLFYSTDLKRTLARKRKDET